MDLNKIQGLIENEGLGSEFNEVIEKALTNWACEELVELAQLYKSTYSTAPAEGQVSIAKQMRLFALTLKTLAEGRPQ